MTAKEYLQQYRDADCEINVKLEQIQRLRELATKTTQVLTSDRVQSSAENKLEHICAKIADLEDEVNRDIDQLAETKKSIEVLIRRLPDASQRCVLELRYIVGLRWEEIAVRMHYQYRWVLELHGRGLQTINTAL